MPSGWRTCNVENSSITQSTSSSQTRCRSWMIASCRSLRNARLSSIRSCRRSTNQSAVMPFTLVSWHTRKISSWSKPRSSWWSDLQGHSSSRESTTRASSWRTSLAVSLDPTRTSSSTTLTSKSGSTCNTWTRSSLNCIRFTLMTRLWSDSHSYEFKSFSGRRTKGALTMPMAHLTRWLTNHSRISLLSCPSTRIVRFSAILAFLSYHKRTRAHWRICNSWYSCNSQSCPPIW